jgi:hypothetical protein
MDVYSWEPDQFGPSKSTTLDAAALHSKGGMSASQTSMSPDPQLLLLAIDLRARAEEIWPEPRPEPPTSSRPRRPNEAPPPTRVSLISLSLLAMLAYHLCFQERRLVKRGGPNLRTGAQRFHISLRSRCTAMLAGLRTLIQTRHGPDW